MFTLTLKFLAYGAYADLTTRLDPYFRIKICFCIEVIENIIMKLSEEIGQQTLVAMFYTMFISKNKNLCNSGHVLNIHFCA